MKTLSNLLESFCLSYLLIWAPREIQIIAGWIQIGVAVTAVIILATVGASNLSQ